MGTLIDTSVLIALERGQIDLSRLTGDDDEPVAIAAITASELLHGVHRLRSAVARTHASRFVERLLDAIPVIPFDLDIRHRAGACPHRRRAVGRGNSGWRRGSDDRGDRGVAGLSNRDARSAQLPAEQRAERGTLVNAELRTEPERELRSENLEV